MFYAQSTGAVIPGRSLNTESTSSSNTGVPDQMKLRWNYFRNHNWCKHLLMEMKWLNGILPWHPRGSILVFAYCDAMEVPVDFDKGFGETHHYSSSNPNSTTVPWMRLRTDPLWTGLADLARVCSRRIYGHYLPNSQLTELRVTRD